MSIRVARNETSGWARARVADTIAEGKGRESGMVRGRVREGGRRDKRERQSCAISKRPITSERSELEKMARENRNSPDAGWRREEAVRARERMGRDGKLTRSLLPRSFGSGKQRGNARKRGGSRERVIGDRLARAMRHFVRLFR